MRGNIPTGNPTRSPSSSLKRPITAAFFVASIALFLIYASLMGLIGPVVRWTLLLVILFIGAAWSINRIARNSVAVKRLRWRPDPSVEGRRPAESLRDLVLRADKGMRFSQMLLAQKVRDILLERMRVVKGIQYGRINELRRDPRALEAFLGDWELAEFIVAVDDAPNDLATGTLPPDSPIGRPGGEFTRYLRHILDRMEAWH